jgi:hypothetical protein
MTPQEKAKELTEKMFNVDLNCSNESMCMLYPHALLCALLAVDEIMEVCYYTREVENNDLFSYDYWQEVKQEIQKL